ncbi:MAG: hypothetical protein HC788_06635 [Sphingopyxis sp.]|nr:hypothetical protein [Sphingopyxis sp.]
MLNPLTPFALTGECELITAGLGLAQSATAGMVQLFDQAEEVATMASWFDRLWGEAQEHNDIPMFAQLNTAAS